MSEPGELAKLVGRIAYQFSLVQPALPTFFGLLLAALFPIYCGAHASLSLPSSAAKPKKRKSEKDKGASDAEDDESSSDEEPSSTMSELRPEDALWFPLVGGLLLGGLYLLIKWLDDTELLNRVLNVYFSFLGVASVGRLLGDSMAVVSSYYLPQRWSDRTTTWHNRKGTREFVVESSDLPHLTEAQLTKLSPFPGLASNIDLGPRMRNRVWAAREALTNKYVVRISMRGRTLLQSRFGLTDLLGFTVAIFAVIGYNFVGQPWWLVNLLGFGLSYGALQIISPRTFWTGTMVLSSLFCYDVYMVFFTPLMTTVAKSLNVPVKLLVPRPRGPKDDPQQTPLAMLGLGDVVLPGIMIALALRFDLYLFYLRKQTRRPSLKPTVSEDEGDDSSVDRPMEVVKAPYHSATGRWGERFWTQRRPNPSMRIEGGNFPKPYFHASLAGYILGLIVTFGVLAFTGHAQPALLYLVPGVMIVLWGLAAVRGDFREMWEYVDVAEEEGNADETPKKSTSLTRLGRMGSLSKKGTSETDSDRKRDGNKDSSRTQSTSGANAATTSGGGTTRDRRKEDELITFTITRKAYRNSSSRSRPGSSGGSGPSSSTILQDIRDALDGDLGLRVLSSPASSAHSNSHHIPQQRQSHHSGAGGQGESPVEKRPRLE